MRKTNNLTSKYLQSIFQSVADVTDDAVISVNTIGEITMWNKAAEEIFGYTSDFALGKKTSLIVPENLLEQSLAIANDIIAGNNNYLKNFETIRLDKNGNSINVSINFSAIIGTNNKVIGILELIKNITEKKEAQKKLNDSSKIIEDYKYALDKSSILATTDQKGIITYVNDNFCKISKYSQEELIGQDHRIINSGYHTKEYIRSIWTTIANGDVWQGEIKNKAKDGTYYWVNTTIVPFLNEQGKPYQYVAIRKDITLRKENEKKLKDSLKLIEDYKHALDESSIVCIADQFYNIKYVNDNFCKISKYSQEELIGQSYRIITSGHHSQEFTDKIVATINNGKIWRGEIKHKAKDNTFYWVDTTVVPFLDDEKKPYQHLIITNDITARKKVEDELLLLNITLEKKVRQRTKDLELSQKSLEKSLEHANFLAAIANSIQDPILTLDKDRLITNLNDAAEKTFGWTNEDALGKNTTELFNIDYVNISRDEMWNILRTYGYWHGEGVGYTKIGKKLTVLITASILKDFDGNIIGVVAICRDITERKKAEEALNKLNNELELLVEQRTKEVYVNEEKYRTLFNNNPLPAFLLEYETCNFLDINQQAIDLYGYNREEWLSMNIFDIRKGLEAKKKEYEKHFEFKLGLNQICGVWEDLKKDGSIVLVEVTTNDFYSNGKKIRLVINNDVTEKKAIEQKLVASEAQLRHTLDNMLEGAQIIDHNWRYTYVNDTVLKHGKYSREELIGYTMMEKYPGIENTEIFKVIQQCFKDKVPVHLENEFVYPDNSTGWFELSIQPVPEGIFILSVDITERKKADWQIQKFNEILENKVAERTEQLENANKELDSFSYSVSHDLRSPLRAITGYSSILLEDFGSKLGDEAKRVTTNIVTSVNKMSTLIDDLLSFSKLGRKQLERMNVSMLIKVNEVCQEVEMQYHQKQINFNIHKLKPAYADPALLRQVWVNLISNAVKYSQNKPVIEVEIGNLELENNNTCIGYYVKDNGAGFDMSYYDKLFGVFQRLHSDKEFEGTGVGLAIVQRIIAKHEGKIWAESKLNEGTTFYFTLKKQEDDLRTN